MKKWSIITAVSTAAAVCIPVKDVSAQVRASQPTAVGVWHGTSLCLVRPSACNDEVVVYRISRGKASDSLSMDGRRIVNGQEVEMGVLGCRLTVPDQFSCAIPSGVWRFTVRADSMVGELRRTDSTKVRDVRAARG